MSNRKFYQDSVTPLPAEAGLTKQGLIVNEMEHNHDDEKMTILFSLSIPAQAQTQLEARVARGEIVSPEELTSKYAPQTADTEALKAWLTKEGFHVVQEAPDNTGIYAEANLKQIQDSLQVHMVRVTRNGQTYTAAKDAPSLPAAVGKSVHAILGLQPFRKANKQLRAFIPDSDHAPIMFAKAAPAITSAPPYLVPEILKAYGAQGLPVTGKGQTIAILIDTFPQDADLLAFWQKNASGVTLGQIQKINVKGGLLPPADGEETLDTSWASGIAPGAKIRIYASGSLSFVDLDRALDRILTDLPAEPELRQLSISLGLGETYMVPGEVAAQHQRFLRLAAAGVNVFISSGDAGSNPDVTGHNATGPIQVEYEASDPFVVGVGGTSLRLNADGSVKEETAWVASGGGKSIFFARPAWQTGAGAVGTRRLVPDVSLVADPNTGAFLVLHGKVAQYGGTSWSAPVWAGFCALLNEARQKAGLPRLPFLNPLLYPLQGTASFRDIQTGNNGKYPAKPGYDMVTGLGVPNVRALIHALTQAPLPTLAPAAKTAKRKSPARAANQPRTSRQSRTTKPAGAK